ARFVALAVAAAIFELLAELLEPTQRGRCPPLLELARAFFLLGLLLRRHLPAPASTTAARAAAAGCGNDARLAVPRSHLLAFAQFRRAGRGPPPRPRRPAAPPR